MLILFMQRGTSLVIVHSKNVDLTVHGKSSTKCRLRDYLQVQVHLDAL